MWIKALFCRLCHFLGITRLAAWLNRNQVIILCYHGVTASPVKNPDDPKGLHVRRERFAQQLEYLRRNYHIIALDDYLKARAEARALPPYTAVVTFDDGFRNFLTVAAPVLNEAGIPATLFLIADRLSVQRSPKQASWSAEDDREYLIEPEVSLLARYPGIRFGSHTRSHVRLTELSAGAVDQELRGSYERLKQLTANQGGLALAYPFGYSSPAVASQARRAGFTAALTTDAGGNDAATDIYNLRRLLIGDDDTLPIFAARVSGLFWMIKAALRPQWRRQHA